jgi:hypothetical protein
MMAADLPGWVAQQAGAAYAACEARAAGLATPS